ncbi:hypothetical protein Tco_0339192 [Tanacetum coccineum]
MSDRDNALGYFSSLFAPFVLISLKYFACRFGKLHPRADGLFRAHKRINDNAYKIDLPGEYHVSATFNVADLSPYFTDEEDSNVEETDVRQDSRSNLLLAGGMMAWALNGKISISKVIFSCFRIS